MGLAGRDEPGDILERQLTGAGVGCGLERQSQFPTITKLRVISRHQQLIRLDFEDGFPGVDGHALMQTFEALHWANVMVSDYGKGTLQDVAGFIKLARAAGRQVLVDPKGMDSATVRDRDYPQSGRVRGRGRSLPG